MASGAEGPSQNSSILQSVTSQRKSLVNDTTAIDYVNYTQKCDPNAQLSPKQKTFNSIFNTHGKSAVRANDFESSFARSTKN